MFQINIPNKLRDYVERLNYEEIRYQDLLKTVQCSEIQFDYSEWSSSYKYYTNCYNEAKLCKEFALEEIGTIYKDEIKGNPWYINFQDSTIVVGQSEPEEFHVVSSEPYSNQLERLYFEDVETMTINSRHTKTIVFQVTDDCNMNCSYCYQHSKSHHSMDFDTAKKLIDMLLAADERTNSYIDADKVSGIIFDFIGGEPWLEIDLINKISDYFIGELFRRKHPWATRYMFSVCSNGLLHLDPKVQKYIKKHFNHLSYSISIDGNKELHDSCRVDKAGKGTYDRAILGVQDCQQNLNLLLGSKMTIAPDNVDKVYEAVKHMISVNNYSSINLNCVYEDVWTKEHANILYWQLHKITDWLIENNLQDKISLSIFSETCGIPLQEENNHNWCGGAGLMLSLDYKGDIYPCFRYMESSSNKDFPAFIIGDVEHGINIEPEHQARVAEMRTVTRRSQSTDECFNCPIAAGCGWCSAFNYENFGTVNKRTTFICIMHKARALANVYYWRRKGINHPMTCPKEWAIDIIGEEEYNKLNAMEMI